jgi:hypothetical protein
VAIILDYQQFSTAGRAPSDPQGSEVLQYGIGGTLLDVESTTMKLEAFSKLTTSSIQFKGVQGIDHN